MNPEKLEAQRNTDQPTAAMLCIAVSSQISGNYISAPTKVLLNEFHFSLNYVHFVSVSVIHRHFIVNLGLYLSSESSTSAVILPIRLFQ